eukprot:CAMPEP_0170505630 /NCGR_PEP_ID=MMETSP0208-20121228/51586_1 /TAXON_ID=197538 /ORGANISM="Strombidium inclinatum, Strain S3" /LENGTH=37 /DNA_ID= /DNA_START= /DNA_END= /DNA_ORIENTATION=
MKTTTQASTKTGESRAGTISQQTMESIIEEIKSKYSQ